jgi:hypothetical protein
VSFAAITLRVASQRVFIVVYFVIDPVRKLLYTPSHNINENMYRLTKASGYLGHESAEVFVARPQQKWLYM